MEARKYKTALIVGAGEGLSASLARLFTREGIRVALAARQTDKLGSLCKETGATAYPCDATNLDDVTRLFAAVDHDCGAPDIVVYNASGRTRGALVDLIPADVSNAIAVSAFGGFLVAQQAARRMLPNRHGAILFTGASASVKGYPQSAASQATNHGSPTTRRHRQGRQQQGRRLRQPSMVAARRPHVWFLSLAHRKP